MCSCVYAAIRLVPEARETVGFAVAEFLQYVQSCVLDLTQRGRKHERPVMVAKKTRIQASPGPAHPWACQNMYKVRLLRADV
jgi:hypothetical protein